MYDDYNVAGIAGGSSPYEYEANPGYGLLQSGMEQTMGYGSSGTALGGQFAQVMSSMSNSINQSASQGRVQMFGGNAAQYDVNVAQAQKLGVKTFGGMTAAQIAQQMSTGGAMSVLPALGAASIPQLVYPIAGLWTLYDGVKAIAGMRRDLAMEKASGRTFDPNQLGYNQAMHQMEEASAQSAYLGPLHY